MSAFGCVAGTSGRVSRAIDSVPHGTLSAARVPGLPPRLNLIGRSALRGVLHALPRTRCVSALEQVLVVSTLSTPARPLDDILLVALGIDADRKKHVLDVREGRGRTRQPAWRCSLTCGTAGRTHRHDARFIDGSKDLAKRRPAPQCTPGTPRHPALCVLQAWDSRCPRVNQV
jgi:hypothetical protein